MRELQTPQQAAQWLRQQVRGQLRIDSRRVQAGDGFIAWPGAATDGRQYMAQALAQGAAACLMEREGSEPWHRLEPADQLAALPGLKHSTGWVADAYYERPSQRLRVLAVTGTNGKTTLTEFLAFAHKRAGRNAVACGNIGLPLTTLAADPAVSAAGLLPIVEVSSFQSEDLRHFRPEAVLWTNLDEDHLDRHGDMEGYFRAKHKLVERLLPAGILVVGESVVAHARALGIALPDETLVARREDVAGSVPAGSPFATWPQLENWALAVRYWEARGLPPAALEDAARLFRTGPHRLRKVAESGLVEFWNDSKGTNFHAVLAALAQFSVPVRWIGGGKWKGGDLRRFAENVAPLVDSAWLIGETAPELERHFLSLGRPVRRFDSLQDAVLAAAKDAPAPTVVLLSPGFSSFDMFRSYAERGVVFERAAAALARR